jgi:hypothetical protein
LRSTEGGDGLGAITGVVGCAHATSRSPKLKAEG